jgi:hypothetical protein
VRTHDYRDIGLNTQVPDGPGGVDQGPLSRLNRECMAFREAYKGYVLQADPVRRGGRWVAGIIIELHQGAAVHYQPVSADPAVTYVTREEAEQASIQFGKVLLDLRSSR